MKTIFNNSHKNATQLSKVIVFLILTVLASGVQAQPELLMDVNTSVDMNAELSRSFTRTSTQVFYVQNAVLWVTKGTPASTIELKKFTVISSLTVSGSSVYFAANDGTGSGTELWKSNGTVSGTVKVKDIFAGPVSSEPRNITVVNASTIYFSANDGQHGREIWKTNGTGAGTVLVKDIVRVKGSSNPTSICKVGSLIFFAANDGQNGIELWKSDGTTDGTLMVKNINSNFKTSSQPQLLTEVAGNVYFKANNGISGIELYKSDGTATGTLILKDIRVGSNSGDVQNLINVNGTLFFTANDGIHGDELWKSNGTPGSTIMVEDFNPGAGGSNNTNPERFPMGNFSNMNGILFFTAGKGTTQEFVVRSDGTQAGTYRVADMKSIGYNPLQPCFTYLKGMVYYFNKITDVNGYDQYYLFRVDKEGNDLGAIQQYRVPEGFYENFFQDAIAYDNMLLTTNLTDHGWDILKQSLTGETQVLHTGYGPTAPSFPDQMVKAGNFIYFSTYIFWPDLNITFELWRTDGTANGTAKIFDFSTERFEMLAVGNKLFFTSRSELYVTEGEGPAFLFYSDDPIFMAHGLTDVNGVVYFHNEAGQLWKSDGTRAGTVLVRSLNKILSITNVGGKAFVLNETPSGGLELWRTNTTGMLRVKILREGDAIRSEFNPTASIANNFFFVGNDGHHGNELWRSDGTAFGTMMVKDLNTIDSVNANGNEDDIRSFTVFNNKLYVSCKEGNDWSLSVVTGKNSTASIARLRPVNQSIIYHNKMYMFTQDIGEAQSLWVTDGLQGGVTDLIGRNFYSAIDEAFVGDNLYFTTWSDRILYQIADCGIFRVNLPEVTVIEGLGDNLIYNGYRIDVGYELFIYRNVAAFTNSCPVGDETQVTQSSSTLITWPNPYTNDFSLRIAGTETETVNVEVFDSFGAPVQTLMNLQANTDYTQIGATWPKGIYFLKIHYRSSIETRRVFRR